ncbi:MAG: nitrilase family protein [Candidatus Omnitrophica bacterium]|nr:nitrilase family protein [Candidatus Omnitrophota bacterium]
MRDIRVAAVQFEPTPNDKEINRKKIRRFVEQAAERHVEMVAFPECCITGYWYLRHSSLKELENLAEAIPGGTSTQFLLNLSKKYKLSIGAGLIEKAEDGNLYNTYLLVMPNGKRKKHRKIHAFISKYISCGSEYTVFDTPHGCRIGILICYDNNIGENVRITALKGAEILLAPHQTGGCNLKNPHVMGLVDQKLWENRHQSPEVIEAEFRGPKGRGWLMHWLPTRAHDNGLFLVFSNGVGIDDDEIRTGNTMVIDPYGDIIVETWKADDDMVVADLKASLREQCTGRRWIKARRPELYKPLIVPTGMEQNTRSVRFGG